MRGSGNDSVNAGAGDDTINAGDGENTVTSGDGNDSIATGAGNDTINSGNNNDTINSGSGNDTIDAGLGDDTVDSGAGDDSINAGDGENTVTSGDGNDNIATGAGNDTINSGNNNDTINSGSGNDSIDAGLGDDTVDSGSGDDSINAGDGENTVTSGDGNDNIATGAGNDTIDAGLGDDTINAGAGNDTISAGLGSDTIIAGDGDDSIQGDLASEVPNENIVTNGDFTIGTSGANNVPDGWTLTGTGGLFTFAPRTDGQGFALGGFDDTVDATLSQDLTTVEGTSYNLTFDGGISGDINGTLRVQIRHSDGTIETLAEITDSNSLDGITARGPFNFTARGGTSRLIFDFDDTGTNSDFDIDNVSVVATNTALIDGDDSIDAGAGNDTIATSGGNDTIDAGSGNDSIDAGSGNDSVNAGAGDDTITTGAGNDTIDAGSGNDTIYVGTGDNVSGGADRDTFLIDRDNLNGGTIIIDGGSGSTAANDADDFDVLDLTGFTWRYTNITTEEVGTVGESRSGTAVVSGHPNGDFTINFSEIESIICFARGTLIETDEGQRPIEELSQGDYILTADNSYQEISWIGARRLDAAMLDAKPNLKPIHIRKGALGNNLPLQDLIVSPQHRILISSKIAERMFGEKEVLVAAKHLTALEGIEVMSPKDGVEYHHFLCENHEIIYANGVPSETLFTGPEALKAVAPQAREEILEIFPELTSLNFKPRAARKILKGRLGRKLAKRHSQNRKMLNS